jgi:hypothetical protein
MRFVLVLVALVLVAGCGEDDETEAPASSQTPFADLTVSVENGGTTTVRCETPDDSEVCRALAGIKPKTFEPVPGDVACTQQYGGPEKATVKGTLDGKEIDATFSRVNGCEITRWDEAKPLLEAAG